MIIFLYFEFCNLNSAFCLYADGSLGSGTARLHAPYEDNSSDRGLAVLTLSTLRKRIIEAYRNGYSVAIHAIGDKANGLPSGDRLGKKDLSGKQARPDRTCPAIPGIGPNFVPPSASSGFRATGPPRYRLGDGGEEMGNGPVPHRLCLEISPAGKDPSSVWIRCAGRADQSPVGAAGRGYPPGSSWKSSRGMVCRGETIPGGMPQSLHGSPGLVFPKGKVPGGVDSGAPRRFNGF